MSTIDHQLADARHRLLDLTLRNRLLNHRPSKARSLAIPDEFPREVYDRLVVGERAMWFKPAESPEDAAVQGEDEAIWALPSPEADAEAGAPPAEGEPAARHLDRFLQTTVPAEQLQKRLFYIYQQSRSVLDEQGYTVLYLALGFLEWRDAREPDVVRRAPLILVPVDLERKRVGSAFKLAWTKEEIHTNISLQAKLVDENVALPELVAPEEKEGIDVYFTAVEDAIAARDTWRVVPEICLDFFSFTKFVMYKDLAPESWPGDREPATHELLRAILDPDGTPEAVSDETPGEASGPEFGDAADGFPEEALDAVDPHEMFHVMDADPSQMAVIEDVKAGRNLVVEGPPGTGKSQTIANVIAEALAVGKSVLFVSEKMAALDVVKHRLDRVGLGAFCLELHSRKSRKKEVLAELERSLATEQPAAPGPTEEIARLLAVRTELNDYAASVGAPVGETDYTPFALFQRRTAAEEHFARAGRQRPSVTDPTWETATRAGLDAARGGLERLDSALATVHPVQEHAWFGTAPGLVMPAEEPVILALVREARATAAALRSAAVAFAARVGLGEPTTPGGVATALDAAALLARAPAGLTEAQLAGDAWTRAEADRVIELARTFDRQRGQVGARMKLEIIEEDVVALREDLRSWMRSVFRFLSGRYRRAKRKLHSFYRVRPPNSGIEWLVDLDKVRQAQEARAEVTAAEAAGGALFGGAWQGAASDPRALEETADWIEAFRAGYAAGSFTPLALRRVTDGAAADEGEIAAERDAVITAGDRFHDARTAFVDRVKLDPARRFGKSLDGVTFDAWDDASAAWSAAGPSLQRWSQFATTWADCAETAAAAIATSALVDDLHPGDLAPLFDGAVADALLAAAFRDRPALARFDGPVHERRVEQFRELDLAFIESNRTRLAHRLFERRPSIAGGASPRSEAGVLLGEFNRKRGHLPIRQLMKRAGGLVQRIKPCFMMSPLSIAQFLDPDSAQFDLVVFDEASQVRPEDALGALMRGRQAVVMGDTRQLPPTSFFDHLIDSAPDEASDAAALGEVESILHQCRRAFTRKTLRWHYRSVHESLIALSNHWFYDERLRIYPSPHQRVDRLGLHHRHLPDTVYDRGKTGVNRGEARAVAEAAVEHYRRFPEKSLGIGAFNVRQQEAILEEIERALGLAPELESRFYPAGGEPFFVKNLETIQGDERDVVFLSLGFGFDERRKLSRNFGPLNQEGGERRLNVLITRARERCVVFSNFRHEDLRVEPSSALGLRALRAYIAFAATRSLEVEASPAGRANRFVERVRRVLAGRGYRTDVAIGCAGFRVDAAVSPDGEDGRYAIGIESDGPKYHLAAVARDRDRLRAQVLERLGWRIEPVWSIDWFRNPDEATARLVAAVEDALEAGRRETEAAPREPAPGATSPAEPEEPSDEAGVPEKTGASEGTASETKGEPEEAPTTVPPDATPAAGTDVGEQDESEAPPSFEAAAAIEEGIAAYRIAEHIGIPTDGALTDQTTARLTQAVVRVVKTEGPVHEDEVVRRIRTAWGLKRTGRRVQEALDLAIAYAREKERVVGHGGFLWPVGVETCPIRRRRDRRLLKLDLIPPEEWTEAAAYVLAAQFATPIDELAVKVSRLVGYTTTSAKLKQSLIAMIEAMVEAGRLRVVRDGVVDLATDAAADERANDPAND